MLEWFSEYGMFLAKSITIIVGFIICVVTIIGVSIKQSNSDNRLDVQHLNKFFNELRDQLEQQLLSKDEWKTQLKKRKKEEKKSLKKSKKNQSEAQELLKKRIFVLDFDGDIKASEAKPLSKEISSVLTIAQANDEVVLRLESPGGVVHGYGLAASQLKRLREKDITLTICVDKVAASGGYMMACVADKIVAAPFAIIGSIGVVAQLPNFNRLLKKHNVDYDIYTAGEYKRTVTILGENTEEGKQKLKSDLHETHLLFKDMIVQNRPQVDIDAVATGEIWYGQQAIDKQLIDELGTSDSYLMSQLEHAQIYHIKYQKKQTLKDKISQSIVYVFETLYSKILLSNDKYL